MIMFCLFITPFTCHIANFFELALSNSNNNSLLSRIFFWIFHHPSFLFFGPNQSSFFCFSIFTCFFSIFFASLNYAPFYFCFFGLIMFSVIFLFTDFTVRDKTIFVSATPMKLRQRFNFFTLRTSFCYNRFRHGFFLIKKLCLEPVTKYAFVAGLFIIQQKKEGVKWD